MRSVWAILAGFILIGVLGFGTDAIMKAMSPWAFNESGGTSNIWILIVQMLYSAVYGVVGCYVAARLAPSHPMRHALILGLIGLLAGGYANFLLWGHVPAWFPIINVLLIMPLAWLGGRLREKELVTSGS
ncbi:MAG TPA: hypothetical protein VFO55_09665 [Gemmatimonadaceae bacterium]|nr:hypothetical protein [Gemmatimonadaceae bacterium]